MDIIYGHAPDGRTINSRGAKSKSKIRLSQIQNSKHRTFSSRVTINSDYASFFFNSSA